MLALLGVSLIFPEVSLQEIVPRGIGKKSPPPRLVFLSMGQRLHKKRSPSSGEAATHRVTIPAAPNVFTAYWSCFFPTFKYQVGARNSGRCTAAS